VAERQYLVQRPARRLALAIDQMVRHHAVWRHVADAIRVGGRIRQIAAEEALGQGFAVGSEALRATERITREPARCRAPVGNFDMTPILGRPAETQLESPIPLSTSIFRSRRDRRIGLQARVVTEAASELNGEIEEDDHTGGDQDRLCRGAHPRHPGSPIG
jgi:hypothetical protein